MHDTPRGGSRATGPSPSRHRPAPPPAHAALIALLEQGKTTEAAAGFAALAAHRALDAAEHHDHGVALHRLGRPEEALAAFVASVGVDPERADTWSAIGRTARRLGHLDDAAVAFASALRLAPHDHGLVVAHAGVLLELQHLDRAARLFELARRLRPDAPDGDLGLGDVALQSSRFEAALAHFDAALATEPTSVGARVGRGTALLQLGRRDEAVAVLLDAFERAPENVAALNNLALAARAVGEHETAITLFERTIALDDSPDHRFNLALAALSIGRFDIGWDAWRHGFLPHPNARGHARRHRGVPSWSGEPVAGRSLLLWAEQGLGDEVMFASLLPEAVATGARITMTADPRLAALLQRSFPTIAVLPRDLPDAQVEQACAPEWQLPLGDLPWLWRRSVEAFERQLHGYLAPCPARRDDYARALARPPAIPAIGLTWKGGHKRERAEARSVPLHALLERIAPTGAIVVSLQYGVDPDELALLRERLGKRFVELPELDRRDDVDGLAALAAACDRVIGATNAGLHVAAAVGTPVSALVPYASDPRWTRGSARSLWYPRLAILRQRLPGDWTDCLDALPGHIGRRVA